MCDIVVNFLMSKMEKKKYNDVKLKEIKYYLTGFYSLITKMVVLTLTAYLLGIIKEYFIFLLFFIPLRTYGFGVHAKSELSCWIWSSICQIGFPYFCSILNFPIYIKISLWVLSFICILIFCPAQTEKRPIRDPKYKKQLKIKVLIISIIYLPIIIYAENISELVIGSMFLQAFSASPLSYWMMGQKIMFSINDINCLYEKRKEA